MKKRIAKLVITVCIGLSLAGCGNATTTSLVSPTVTVSSSSTVANAKETESLKTLNTQLTVVGEAIKKKDVAGAKAAYAKFDDGWLDVEEAVSNRSKDIYRDVENSMGDLSIALRSNKPVAELQPYYDALQTKYTSAIKLVETTVATNNAPTTAGGVLTVAKQAGGELSKVLDALKRNDLANAKASYKIFDDSWGAFEIAVRNVSKDLYRELETNIRDAGRELLRNDKAVATAIVPLVAKLDQNFAKALQQLEVAAKPAITGTKVAAISGPEVDAAVKKVNEYLKVRTESLTKTSADFVVAVKTRDVAKAKAAYETTRRDYESIEFLAEAFSDLDVAIDARPDDFPLGENDPTWTGFHPLEKAIYADAKLDERTDKLADQLTKDIGTLLTQIKAINVEPAIMINGAAELIEEIQAGKITGEEERYSHTDLNDFKANFTSAKFVYEAFSPFVKMRNAALDTDLRERFSDVEKSIAGYFDAQDRAVDYSKIADPERKILAQKVEALADSFSRVLGTLGLQS